MKTYRYRKHIRRMGIVIPGFLFLLALLLLYWPSSDTFGVVGIVIAAALIFEAIVIYFVMRRFAKVEVSLGPEAISYQGKGGKQEIPYKKIRALKYSMIPYTGGWIKIVTESTNIRLTVVLEGIGEFVEELKSRLDQSDLSDKYERSKLFRFYKTAEYGDQSWARIYERFWKAVAMFFLSVAVGGAIGYIQTGGKWTILEIELWTLGPFIWGLVVYCMAEFVLIRRFAKSCDEENFTTPERDLAAEKLVFKRAAQIGVSLCVAIIILVLFLSR